MCKYIPSYSQLLSTLQVTTHIEQVTSTREIMEHLTPVIHILHLCLNCTLVYQNILGYLIINNNNMATLILMLGMIVDPHYHLAPLADLLFNNNNKQWMLYLDDLKINLLCPNHLPLNPNYSTNPRLTSNKHLVTIELCKIQHFTAPPPRNTMPIFLCRLFNFIYKFFYFNQF